MLSLCSPPATVTAELSADEAGALALIAEELREEPGTVLRWILQDHLAFRGPYIRRFDLHAQSFALWVRAILQHSEEAPPLHWRERLTLASDGETVVRIDRITAG